MRRKKIITLATIFKFIVFVALLVFLYSTTYGWRANKTILSSYSKRDESIAAELKKHVNVFSRDIGWRGIDQYENLKKTEQYILDFFANSGLGVERQEFVLQGKPVANIIVKKVGVRYPQRILVVGAHYDSYFNPGADNNASGVSALLELGKLLVQQELGASVHLVFFAAKEPPFFGTQEMGSVRYAKSLKNKNQVPLAAFILDSIGYYSEEKHSQRYPPLLGLIYPDKGNFLAVVGNAASTDLLNKTVSLLKKETSVSIQGVRGFDFINSDHWAFWKEKFETLLLTDTGGYRNPNYYSLSDSGGELNYLNIAQISKALLFVLLDLAK